MTGHSGDVLTIKIDPEFYEYKTLDVWLNANGEAGSANLLFFGPYNSAEQRVLVYDVNAYGTIASAKLTAHLPKPRKTGIIKIHKVDADTGESISGVLYDLGDSTGNQVRSAVTDSSGYAVFEDLALGEYFYVEESAPEGYIVDKSKHYVTISKNGQVITETRKNKFEEAKGSIEIYKIDADAGDPIKGVSYALYDKFGRQIRSGSTDANSTVSFTDLPLGEYSYQEKSAPDGYILDAKTHCQHKYQRSDYKGNA